MYVYEHIVYSIQFIDHFYSSSL